MIPEYPDAGARCLLRAPGWSPIALRHAPDEPQLLLTRRAIDLFRPDHQNRNQRMSYLFRGACLAIMVAPCGVPAQPFPSKPIEFVVPGNPGAGSDIFARLIADIIRKE